MSERSAFLPHFFRESVYLLSDAAEEKRPQHSAAEAITAPEPFAYEGSHQRGVMVVTDVAGTEERTLLKNILAAVALTSEDVALVVLPTAFAWEGPCASLQTRYLLGFGATFDPALGYAPYTVSRNHQTTFLLADSLAQLRQDQARKRQLWLALKQLFTP